MLPFPHPINKPCWLPHWWRDVVSAFHHTRFPLLFLLPLSSGVSWLSGPCWPHSSPLDSFSVFVGPGTIRKAQNLLKQYSQHGLDGKKGGSNLTPLEGKAPWSSLSLFSNWFQSNTKSQQPAKAASRLYRFRSLDT